jgi:predicted acyl esterase
MVRARYREGPQEERFLTPGEVVEYEVVCWDVAHTFRPGHRIAVTIASADFPRRDRNPNVARPIASVARSEVQVAEQTVHRGGARPSRLVLPVLGGEG